MSSDEKRVVDGYEVIHTIYIGDREVIVGDRPTAPARVPPERARQP